LAQEIVEAPITGKVVSVEVKAGDTVQEGDVICYIEFNEDGEPNYSSSRGYH